MSQYYKFDIDDALWENEVEEKPKAKKIKQRRVDVKRRYADEYAELDFEVNQYN
ncbi:small highly charged protein [Shewanella sp. TC10]|uniref:small highly charged protein n=1 Tax=Shewanella sp. TC10 TaxID=1419739 RepID=UPI00129EAFD8|nr:small highly charged protein [Shewanella sp. TC10]